jgi:hypothetical protein
MLSHARQTFPESLEYFFIPSPSPKIVNSLPLEIMPRNATGFKVDDGDLRALLFFAPGFSYGPASNTDS